MKHILTIIAVFCISAACNAQTNGPNAIVPAGGTDHTNAVEVDWTVGETFSKSVRVNDGMITEGYNQPTLRLLSAEPETTPAPYRFSVAPNPVQSVLTVRSTSESDAEVVIRLMDAGGNIISMIKASAKNDTKEIDMSELAAGMYLVSIKNMDGVLLQSFRIIKAK